MHPAPSVASVYPNAGLHDGVSYATLKNPVVISSGHVFSAETVAQLFMTSANPFVHLLKYQLIQQKIVALPQIAYALKMLAFEREVAALDEKVMFKIVASSNKFRLQYTEPQGGTYLRTLLSKIFEGKQNGIEQLVGVQGYSLADWNRAWGKPVE